MNKLKHNSDCWCYEQKYPHIYNTGMNKKDSRFIHFTCSKCKGHCIISKLLALKMIQDDNDRCYNCQ